MNTKKDEQQLTYLFLKHAVADMGGSRIFDWGGPRIVKARDDRQNVALFALKSWPIGGAMALWPPWNRPWGQKQF